MTQPSRIISRLKATWRYERLLFCAYVIGLLTGLVVVIGIPAAFVFGSEDNSSDGGCHVVLIGNSQYPVC